MKKIPMKLLKWTQPFPIRNLKEMFNSASEFPLPIDYHKQFDENLVRYLYEMFFMQYGERYPRLQNKESFLNLFFPRFITFYQTYINRIWDIWTKKNLKDDGSLIETGNITASQTQRGESMSPYNNNLDGIDDEDDFANKEAVIYKQWVENKNFFENMVKVNSLSNNSQILNFTNTFEIFFSNLATIDKYIEDEIRIWLYMNKNSYNNTIKNWKTLSKYFVKIKK